MKKISMILLFLILSTYGFTQQEYFPKNKPGRMVTTSLIVQSWKIQTFDERCSESTFPIHVFLPINEKSNVTISHIPAASSFGDLAINGLSDTWIQGVYSVYNDKIILSGGIGLPSGKTQFSPEEDSLSFLLSRNMFKFRLPVFGQGFTFSGGAVSAYPVMNNLMIGGGLSFLYKGKYKYALYSDNEFNPGNEINLNIGLDYYYSNDLRANFDIIYTYYSKDRINDTDVFGAGSKINVKLGVSYRYLNHLGWIVLRYRKSGKNETWNEVTLTPETEPLNSNITQREVNGVYRYHFSPIYSLDALLEIRSYVENDYNWGQADIFGIGFRNNLQLLENISLNMAFIYYSGEGRLYKALETLAGTEFRLGTSILF